MSKSVYLAGPISGLSYDEAVAWRERTRLALAMHGIEAYSPMRCKSALAKLDDISSHGRDYAHLSPLAHPRAIMTRDHYDATHCDVMLVNFRGAKEVSVGTVMEIAWAHTRQIPIVAAIDADGNVHDHMMVTEAIDFCCLTLDEAIAVVVGILQP